MNDYHLLFIAGATFLKDDVAVEIGDRDDKSRLSHFFVQHGFVAMDIGAVGCEAEGDARQSLNNECHGGRMTGEMRMDVINALFLHLAGEKR